MTEIGNHKRYECAEELHCTLCKKFRQLKRVIGALICTNATLMPRTL